MFERLLTSANRKDPLGGRISLGLILHTGKLLEVLLEMDILPLSGMIIGLRRCSGLNIPTWNHLSLPLVYRLKKSLMLQIYHLYSIFLYLPRLLMNWKTYICWMVMSLMIIMMTIEQWFLVV